MTNKKLNEALLRCRCDVLMHAELVNWVGKEFVEDNQSINKFAEIQIDIAKLEIAKELQDRLGRELTTEMMHEEGLAWKCSGVTFKGDSQMAKETIADMVSAMAEDAIDLLHLPICDLTDTIDEFINEWTEAINQTFPTTGEEN